MKFMSISELRTNSKAVLGDLQKEGEPYMLIQNSRPCGVLVSLETYEAMQEALEDKEDIRIFDEAKKRSGDFASWDEYVAGRSKKNR